VLNASTDDASYTKYKPIKVITRGIVKR